MLFEGNSLTVQYIEPGIAQLTFNAQGSVNKFDAATLEEMRQATAVLNAQSDLKGVLIDSAKNVFIVGADITEFLELFKKPEEELVTWVKSASDAFDGIEDLKVPTVAAVNGYALGGGCECILATDMRVASTAARIGLPEVKLGLIPGFGGTVRLSRLVGADNAMEWITTGKENKAEAALAVGVVDAVVAPEKLHDAALQMLKDAIDGKLDWQAKRQPKLEPLKLNQIESMMSFVNAKGMVAAKAGKHYPAPMIAVNAIEKGAGLDRAGAMAIENQAFAKVSKTTAATAQVGIFMADQYVKSKAKKASKSATKEIKSAAVLGAGIMGGGIAYQSASTGTPAVMKDINQQALDLGLNEAASILEKGIKRGKSNPKKMASVLNAITPTLEYSAIKDADVVVEAVVENPKVKAIVLKETEEAVADDAIITSNTSTIRIDLLAESLKDPSRFCGMHFFNPVHKMPLVEIIRGKDTSEETISAVVGWATKMRKTAIVVNDCPGFFVNRVLFPYFAGFSMLLKDGADFTAVDKVMEKEFGWPMGPAYLLDVVGIDTADHCVTVMSEGFPERMPIIENDPVNLLYKADRYGQKNGKGFYDFGVDKRGRPTKVVGEDIAGILQPAVGDVKSFDSEEIIDRLMLPMINETIRCLEEGIVASAAEADMALLYGVGFPPFRGGVFRYIETVGLDKIVAKFDKYADLGPAYQCTDGLRDMAANNKSYFQL